MICQMPVVGRDGSDCATWVGMLSVQLIRCAFAGVDNRCRIAGMKANAGTLMLQCAGVYCPHGTDGFPVVLRAGVQAHRLQRMQRK